MALPAVNAELSLGPEPFAVHTSGSLPIDRLNALTSRTGVFYPLQTFSVSRTTSFGQLPVFIETSCEDDLPVLRSFAARFSGKIIEADSTKRRMAHLAAVFACNFTNHMYSLSFDIMKETGLSFELLLPLINETARKVHKVTPDKAQTGPAFRGDQEVIETHLKMLEKEPLYREIYSLLSKSIAGRVNKL
jgi:predicted short-subunit dehydrogenase-like oxidoreductase (DUF2520 family)